MEIIGPQRRQVARGGSVGHVDRWKSVRQQNACLVFLILTTAPRQTPFRSHSQVAFRDSEAAFRDPGPWPSTDLASQSSWSSSTSSSCSLAWPPGIWLSTCHDSSGRMTATCKLGSYKTMFHRLTCDRLLATNVTEYCDETAHHRKKPHHTRTKLINKDHFQILRISNSFHLPILEQLCNQDIDGWAHMRGYCPLDIRLGDHAINSFPICDRHAGDACRCVQR